MYARAATAIGGGVYLVGHGHFVAGRQRFRYPRGSRADLDFEELVYGQLPGRRLRNMDHVKRLTPASSDCHAAVDFEHRYEIGYAVINASVVPHA